MKAIEATFLFPMDVNAAVYRLQVTVGDKTITAECQEKQQAEETYRCAMQAGNLVGRMTQHQSSDIQVLDVGNIPAKCDVTINFDYVIKLSVAADRAAEFKLPTLLSPRSGQPDMATGGPAPRPLHTAPGAIPYKLEFKAHVHTDMKVTDIRAENIPILWQSDDSGTIQVTLKDDFKFDHDIGFNIYYENPSKTTVVMARGKPDSEGILKNDMVMLSFQLYHDPTGRDVIPKMEFVFFVDRSGSMSGSRIAQAREVLTLFLKSLPVGCLFNIISFDDRTETLFLSKEYNKRHLEEALQFSKRLTPRGRTDLIKPLSHMYDTMPLTPGVPRQVFVLTDGQIWNEKNLFSMINKHNDTTRVFGFGIGEGVSTSLVNGLAEAGRGRAEFATQSNDRLHPKVMSCLQKAMQPVMTDVSVAWETSQDGVSVVSFPKPQSFLFCGDLLILYGLINGQAAQPIKATFRGKVDNQYREEELMCDVSSGLEDSAQWLHRLAAKHYIKQLESDELESGASSKKDHIVLVSLATNVMSKYTSFIAVHKDSHVTGNVMKLRIGTASDARGDVDYRDHRSGPISGDRSAGARGRGGYKQRAPAIHLESHDQYRRRKSRSRSRDRRSRSRDRQYSSRSRHGSYRSARESSLESDVQQTSGAGATAYSTLDLLMTDSERLQLQLKNKKMADLGPYSSGHRTGSLLYDVIELQDFDGCWRLTAELCRHLGLSFDDVRDNAPIKDTRVWGTLLTLAWLQAHHSAAAAEWTLLAHKARLWLKTQTMSEQERSEYGEVARQHMTYATSQISEEYLQVV